MIINSWGSQRPFFGVHCGSSIASLTNWTPWWHLLTPSDTCTLIFAHIFHSQVYASPLLKGMSYFVKYGKRKTCPGFDIVFSYHAFRLGQKYSGSQHTVSFHGTYWATIVKWSMSPTLQITGQYIPRHFIGILQVWTMASTRVLIPRTRIDRIPIFSQHQINPVYTTPITAMGL